jgi:integrase
MLSHTPATLTGSRDRAILALGFSGAFRRSELVALDVEDLADDPAGLRVTIRKSKTDQEGRGQQIAVPHGVDVGRVAQPDRAPAFEAEGCRVEPCHGG